MGDSQDHSEPSRRRAPRHQTESQESSIGDVLDLSRVGARLGGQGRPPLKVGETLTLGLHAPEGTLRIPARVGWVRKPKFRHWEMGLEFVDVDRRKQVAAERLARYGCLTVPDEEREAEEAAEAATARPRSRAPRPNSGSHPPRIEAYFEQPDHYRMLQVQPDADEETIRLAFRTLAKRLHPDRNPSPDAQRKFEVLKQAYDVLRDPERRAAHDRGREERPDRADRAA